MPGDPIDYIVGLIVVWLGYPWLKPYVLKVLQALGLYKPPAGAEANQVDFAVRTGEIAVDMADLRLTVCKSGCDDATKAEAIEAIDKILLPTLFKLAGNGTAQHEPEGGGDGKK